MPPAPAAELRPHTPGSAQAAFAMALFGATVPFLIGSMPLLVILAFAGADMSTLETALSLVLAPTGVPLAGVLVAGGARLRTRHADGRWWLAGGALLDLAVTGHWMAHHHLGGAEALTVAWVLGPAVAAATLAWTPATRRWTHPDRATFGGATPPGVARSGR